ncbi:hypothetical protein CSUI_007190 [Cystoisospora suis]|uniref:Transmembrane protein n=1 Tax=Cystoisospora suis TaxID=483139 RepID=A0A2C6KRV0_9APIC|nr:hypothetical protein CSUI_007190 [Cystoisospora suis]
MTRVSLSSCFVSFCECPFLSFLLFLYQLLSYVHHQYFSLLPANTVTPYLSHLCSTILKNLVAHACVSEGSDESSRARVAALIARGEVLLSTFWSDLHKQLKVWTGSRLRNLRRLLFADTPLLLHEASQILKNHQKERKEQRDEEETLKDQPTHQQQEERSLSSSSSRMALNACVFLSLPPLLVISHLLYRLPRCPSSSTSRRIDARQSTESYNRRPHEILHISPSQLAKELSLCIDSSLDEKRNNIDIIRVEEGGEEDERERKELLSSLKLTQDLAYVVEVLKGKKSETSLYSGDGISRGDQEAEMKSISRIRHLRKKGSWRKEKKRQEKRELELLQNVLSLLEHNTKEEESHMERGDQALYPSPPIQEKEEERERSSSSSSSSSDIFQGSTLSFSSPSPPPPHTYPPPPHSYEQHRVLFDSSAPSPSSPSLLPHS